MICDQQAREEADGIVQQFAAQARSNTATTYA